MTVLLVIGEISRALRSDASARRLAGRSGHLRQAYAALFERFDAVVLPSAQVWPFPVDWRWPQQIQGHPIDTYHRWMEIVLPASLVGAPVLGCPAGFGPEGLPMGFQLAGPVGGDARILALGQAYHRATDWPHKGPDGPQGWAKGEGKARARDGGGQSEADRWGN